MADDVKSPFEPPPSHVPAEVDSSVNVPEPFSPANVIGDQLSEVVTPFVQPTSHVPAGAVNVVGDQERHSPSAAVDLFDEQPSHVPAGPYTFASPGPPHVPTGVIGDDLSEVGPVPLVPDPHVPSRVIGDSLNEIFPIAQINPSSPPADVGPSTPAPPSHVGAEPWTGFVQPPGAVPAPTFDVAVIPDVQPIVRDYSAAGEPRQYAPSGQPPEFRYENVLNTMKLTDLKLVEHLTGLGLDPFTAIGGGAPGSHALDPDLYVKWLVDLGKHFGAFGFARFFAQQFALHALNEETSRVFDPLYFAKRAPISNYLTREVVDNVTHEDYALIREQEFYKAAKAALEDTLPTPPFGLPLPMHPLAQLGETNASTPAIPYSEAADLTIRGLVDAALIDEAQASDISAVFAGDAATEKVKIGPVDRHVFKIDAIFESDPIRFSFKPTAAVRNKARAVEVSKGPLEGAAFPKGIIPASLPGEGDDGIVRTRGDQKPSDVVDDDSVYVPLSFTDLRSQGNESRTVYFRPFITSLAESFAPSFNEGSAFGRTDPTMTYQGTTRNVSLGFELHAFAPEDLKVIYKKLHWLTSLVYPEYTTDMLLKSGPVCRMRVGDVIKSAGQGLPGVITSLDFDYTDALWELKKDYKVPRAIVVSLSMTVLHDSAIGIKDGIFGAFKLDGAQVKDGVRGFGEPTVVIDELE